MENVVPAVLQRLRAADIIRVAGLKAASLGQEYYRLGAVQHAQRQGHLLSGIVELPRTADFADEIAALATNPVDDLPFSELIGQTRYAVTLTFEKPTSWQCVCTCDTHPSVFCSHAAALLYQWLARPFSFTTMTSKTPDTPSSNGDTPASFPTSEKVVEPPAMLEEQDHKTQLAKVARSFPAARAAVVAQGPMPLVNLNEIVAQLGLSDLRGIAREYEITTNGLSKQQLVEAILNVLQQPDAVRRMATTLEKSQRQLLAALALAGGSMMDDDLRGMFERFSLGQPSQLQQTLTTLQNKGLLFRTSLNGSSQQRIGLSSALLDIGWFVPLEVRKALRATLPSTPFNVEQADESGITPDVRFAEPQRLLATLLLVARALERQTQEQESGNGTRPTARPTNPLIAESISTSLPAPKDTLSSTLLATIQQYVPVSANLARFAARLLRLADVLYVDSTGTPSTFHVLTNAASLLLGPAHDEVLHDLFELWLTQASYDELFDLQEEGIQIRCRAASLSYPVLRVSEVELENCEARQAIVALLAQAPLNRWLNFTAFARFVYRLNPLFLQRRQRLLSLPHWWLEREEGRSLRPLSLSDWLHAEYYYLARLIRGPLHWWGICDIAVGPNERLLAFRLTPLANWLLHGQPPAALEDEPSDVSAAIEVPQQDEILVASSVHAWPVIQLFEDFAENAGVRAGKLRYHLSPSSLAMALNRGLQPASLLALLRSIATKDSELASLLAQLERWTHNYGRVRVYTHTALLEVADTLVMRELSATTSLDQQIVQSLHPTMHILRRSGAGRLIDDLKRRGQTPLIHHEEAYGTE